MWKLIVIPANVDEPIRAGNYAPGLDSVQKIVGGWVEHVRIGDFSKKPPKAFEDIAMYVNEDGVAKRLPLNIRASFLYGVSRHGSYIFGDAFLAGEIFDPEEGRDIGSVPDWSTPSYWAKLIDIVAVDGLSHTNELR